MDTNLYTLLNEAQNRNKESLNTILVKFKPTINKFSRELGYECAKTDLNIFLIELIQKLDLNKFNSKEEGKIVNYIYNSLKNKKNNLFKKNFKNKIDTLPIELEYIESYDPNIENKILISEFWNLLTEEQQNILEKKFIKGYSNQEIANSLNISRQAVNQCKNRAIERIKESFVLI